MNHLDGERLAAYALDATEDLTPNELDHLGQCDECAGELTELRQLITTGAGAGDPLVAPSGHVWQAITAELAGDETGPATRRADDDQDPIPLRPANRSRDRNWWTIGLVAAVIGVLVGALGVIAIRTTQTPSERVVAEIALEPLPGKAGAGEATLIQTSDGLRLRVSLSDIRVRDADLEVWLINTDGVRMRSLGLSADDGGTFVVPGWLIPDNYRIVDISVEPRDGNLAHSTNSEVRGTLPA